MRVVRALSPGEAAPPTIRSFSLPERSPLTPGEALLARPVDGQRISGTEGTAGTVFVTSFRLLWEATPDAEDSGTGATTVVEVPLHALDSCAKVFNPVNEETTATKATNHSNKDNITADVYPKYAAFPALRLNLSEASYATLSTVLHKSTFSPPTRASDLRASVRRTLAFVHEEAETPAHSADGALADPIDPAAHGEARATATAGRGGGVAEVEDGGADATGWLESEMLRLGVGSTTSRWRLCRCALGGCLPTTHRPIFPRACPHDWTLTR